MSFLTGKVRLLAAGRPGQRLRGLALSQRLRWRRDEYRRDDE